MRPSIRAAALALVPLLAACARPRDAASAGPVTVERMLQWLPADTQTVLVARDPVRAFGLAGLDDLEDEHPERQLPVLVGAWTGYLVSLVNDGSIRRLPWKTLDLAVQGSRRFRPPERGWMRFEGCQLLHFRVPPDAVRDDMVRTLSRHDKPLRIAGYEVLRVKADDPYEAPGWTVYVAWPRPDLLALASDEGYLREVLERMAKPGGPRALPDSLPEWKHVRRDSPLWAIRHYDPADTEGDETTPLRTGGDVGFDPHAVGFTFSVGPRDNVWIVRHLTRAPDVTAAARSVHATYEPPATFEAIDEGVVEVRVAPSERNAGTLATVLAVMLGHFGYP